MPNWHCFFWRLRHTVAIFREVDKGRSNVHHDAGCWLRFRVQAHGRNRGRGRRRRLSMTRCWRCFAPRGMPQTKSKWPSVNIEAPRSMALSANAGAVQAIEPSIAPTRQAIAIAPTKSRLFGSSFGSGGSSLLSGHFDIFGKPPDQPTLYKDQVTRQPGIRGVLWFTFFFTVHLCSPCDGGRLPQIR
jgi:hypothetical protein